MMYVKAFLVGGIICLVSQLLIDRTRLTPARILSASVVLGVVLSGLGLWEPVVKFAGAGATVQEQGLLGAFTGGLTASAGGIAAAVFFSLAAALLFQPGDRS